MRITALAAALTSLSLAVTGHARLDPARGPTAPTAASAEPARAFRINLDAAAHARAADSLRRAGFRPVALDAYGDPARPRFASSWIRAKGPAWSLRHGIAEGDLADSLRDWSRQGRRAVLLTATGPSAAAPSAFRDALAAGRAEPAQEAAAQKPPASVEEAAPPALFAAVVAADTLPAWSLAGLDRDGLRKACDSAQLAGYRPAWLDAYGSAGSPRFAGVWVRNLPAIPWNYSLGDDPASLEGKTSTFAPVWVRPALVVPLPDGKLMTVWQEGSAGPWSLRPAVPVAEAEAALAAEAAAGRHPVSLSGPAAPDSGPHGGPAFTLLCAARAEPLPRVFTAAGPAAPGLEHFDAYMERLMRAHQVRSGALAMVKDGRLVMAKGYTWAEEGYPLTQPTSLFRVASCSKPLTSMAVHSQLREAGAAEGALSLREKVLSLVDPSGAAPADKRFAEITVDDLLSHSAGWVRSPENPDPVFNDYPAGHAIRRRLPGSARDFLSYMLGQPLQFDPGSRSSYANFGYFLLGRILETLPHGLGRSYEQAVAGLVFRPLGLSRPRLGGSLLAERQPGEVLYHTRYPYLQRGRGEGGPAWVPGGYGDFDLRNMEAAGAWILSAPDFAKVLASFDLGEGNPVLKPEAVRTMWAPPHDPRFLRGWFATRLGRRAKPGEGPAPGDSVAKWHNGLFPGTSTMVFYRPDRWSFALFLNRDIAPHLNGDVHGRELGRLADKVESWPEEDLFPEMGIQSFAGQGLAGKPGSPPARDHYSTATP